MTEDNFSRGMEIVPGSKYKSQMFEELIRDDFNPPFEIPVTASGLYFFHVSIAKETT